MNYNTHQSPPIGQEISCVMKGISPRLIRENKKIKQFLLEALNQCNFKIIGTIFHEFQPQGMTLMFLLSESHAAIHTYPEYNALYFSLYTCRAPNDAEKTFNLLKEKINPKQFLFLNNNQIPLVEMIIQKAI